MESIKIIWFRESDRMERASYTVPISKDMLTISRVYAKLCKVLEAEKERKNENKISAS